MKNRPYLVLGVLVVGALGGTQHSMLALEEQRLILGYGMEKAVSINDSLNHSSAICI